MIWHSGPARRSCRSGESIECGGLHLAFCAAWVMVVSLMLAWSAEISVVLAQEMGTDAGVAIDELMAIVREVDRVASRITFTAKENKHDQFPGRKPPSLAGTPDSSDTPYWVTSKLVTTVWQDGPNRRRLEISTIQRSRDDSAEADAKRPCVEIVTYAGDKGLQWWPEEKRAAIQPHDMTCALHNPFAYRVIDSKPVSDILDSVLTGDVAGEIRGDPKDPNRVVVSIHRPSGSATIVTLDRQYGYQVTHLDQYTPDGWVRYSRDVKYSYVDSVPFPESGVARWFTESGEVKGEHSVQFYDVDLAPATLGSDLFWPELPVGTTVVDNVVDASYVIGPPDVKSYETWKGALIEERATLDNSSTLAFIRESTSDEMGHPTPAPETNLSYSIHPWRRYLSWFLLIVGLSILAVGALLRAMVSRGKRGQSKGISCK